MQSCTGYFMFDEDLVEDFQVRDKQILDDFSALNGWEYEKKSKFSRDPLKVVLFWKSSENLY